MTTLPFPSRLRQARLQRGLTQCELDRLARLPLGTTGQYEGQHRAPSLQNFRALVLALRYDPAWFLGIRRQSEVPSQPTD